MQFDYKTKGVCSTAIRFQVDGTTVHDVEIIGGCNGNGQGVAALVEGMDIDDVIRRVKGIHCGFKETSCPDQLAQALELAKKKLEEKDA